jgi:1-acyl-sn-glycerol-3-phosphate acyltransferase
MRRLGVFLMRRKVLRIRVLGPEHVPLEGPVILAGNHTGFLDGPVVFATAPRAAQFFIKEEMYGGVVAPFLDWMGQIPVNRGRPDRRALRHGLAILAAGEPVGMFPEGTRGSGELRTIQHGIGYLALKAGCPVVPVACFGTLDALPPHGKRLRRGTPVDVVYGIPFQVSVDGDPRTRRAMAQAAEEIRTRLAEHLHEAAVQTGRPLPSDEVSGEGSGDGSPGAPPAS